MAPKAETTPRAVVAVAASAGGVEALSGFVGSLPKDFQAAVLVVLHIPPAGPSVLPGILARAGKLSARHPMDGEPLEAGVIFTAPPDRHLAVEDHKVQLLTGPRENGHRPSADTLLRSVAETYGARSAGVVLSGTMDDGAAGLRAVRAVGGFALVQDPSEAAFPGMPQSAIEESSPQEVCPVAQMGKRLSEWLNQLPDEPKEDALSAEDFLDDELTHFTCPECGGTLWARDEYGAHRFRCRVGHSFSADGLLVGKRAALESALWAAVVALEEKADLTRRVVRRLERTGRKSQIERHQHDIATTDAQTNFLRGVIDEMVQSGPDSYEDGRTGAGTAS